MTTVNAEIKKVELDERFHRSVLIVTAESVWGIKVQFEIPTYLAKSYAVGRMVEVSIGPLVREKGRK